MMDTMRGLASLRPTSPSHRFAMGPSLSPRFAGGEGFSRGVCLSRPFFQELAGAGEGVPAGLAFLPAGEPVVTDMHGRALVCCAGGKAARHVDLSPLTGTIDDMIIDPQGRAYVGDLGFDLKAEGVKHGPHGRLILVEADREPRVVADGLDFPNGIALSADGRRLVVAETNRGCLA